MFLSSSLDEEESSRTEISDNGDQTLVVIDTPYAQRQNENAILYSTIPLGVIITKRNLITISLKENPVIKELIDSMVKGINTQFKTRFLFIILYRIATRFLQYLKQIDRIENTLETELKNSMRNKELLQLLDIEKALVYFSTSLKANQMTIERILRGRVLKIYEEDQDLLEDVLIEIKQGVDMSNIYSGIVNTTMNSYSSIISNNLNSAMKFLTSMTILLAIPTLISSFYGVNVKLPIIGGEYAFFVLIVFSLIATLGSYFILKRKDLLS
jgi:magnesium transporter